MPRPSKPPAPPGPAEAWAVRFRGSPEYLRALDKLMAAVNATGIRPLADRNELADYALVRLALERGIRLPPRARKPGRPRKDPG
jgi:hypothetical protein